MTFNLATITAVGLGGSLGAIARFYVAIQVVKHFPHEIPLATLGVNLFGSFFIGIFVGLFSFFTPSEFIKGFVITGFLGALTTYSTFAIESYVLLNNNFWYGVANVILNAAGTILCAGLGYKLITYLLR